MSFTIRAARLKPIAFHLSAVRMISLLTKKSNGRTFLRRQTKQLLVGLGRGVANGVGWYLSCGWGFGSIVSRAGYVFDPLGIFRTRYGKANGDASGSAIDIDLRKSPSLGVIMHL